MSYEHYESKNALKRAFRAGKGLYADGQSSYSVNCQEARERGRLPMTDAIKSLRMLVASRGLKVTISEARRGLRASHDGEWHHVSKYGNRVNYYDVRAALAFLFPDKTKTKPVAQSYLSELCGSSEESEQSAE